MDAENTTEDVLIALRTYFKLKDDLSRPILGWTSRKFAAQELSSSLI